jgi:hypothetical protein
MGPREARPDDGLREEAIQTEPKTMDCLASLAMTQTQKRRPGLGGVLIRSAEVVDSYPTSIC